MWFFEFVLVLWVFYLFGGFLCKSVKLGNICMETKMGLGHGEKKGGFPFW